MELRPGARIGTFEILGPLGAGGMGEVYRARDSRLGREVAVKILPPSVAQDAERLGRFDREARLLAALNHPGIAAIYGVEDVENSRLLILEEARRFVEWTAEALDVDAAAELIDLQLALTLWLRVWEDARSHPGQRALLAHVATCWSERVLVLSGLTTQST